MVAFEQAPGLYVVNSDGTGQTLIFDASSLPGGQFFINGIDWALDDSYIIFGLTDGDVTAANYSIERIDPDGSNRSTIFSSSSFRVGLPSFSYDGTKIAFWSYTSGSTRSVKTMNADGSNVLTAASSITGTGVLGDIQDYAWANTQNRLAVRTTSGNARTVNYDGSSVTNVAVTGLLTLVWKCWAPDDSSIFFSNGTFQDSLYRFDPATGTRTLVYSDAAHVHGSFPFVTFGRVYRSGTQSGGDKFVESVLQDGTDFRFEEGPVANAFSMF